jgi:hypothetical protein
MVKPIVKPTINVSTPSKLSHAKSLVAQWEAKNTEPLTSEIKSILTPKDSKLTPKDATPKKMFSTPRCHETNAESVLTVIDESEPCSPEITLPKFTEEPDSIVVGHN